MFLVCGEALFDLFGVGETASGGMRLDARMGGSPFNVAIGMARLGQRAALLTGISTDAFGVRLAEALGREGVSTHYLLRSGRRTTLSVVALDPSGSPSYAFYGVGSSDASITEADLPSLGADVTGLHLGSYSIAVPPVADAFAALAERERDRFIALDPNVRPSVEPDMAVWRRRIDALRRHADLIKVSEEDIAALHPGEDPERVATAWTAAGAMAVVLTRGGDEVVVWRGADVLRLMPPPVTVADTVGAGDAFQAALLSSLAADGDPGAVLRNASAERLHAILERAARAASLTCQRVGADLPRAAELDVELVN